MEIFGLTDKGITRTANQDAYLIRRCEDRACQVLTLCDGMGGAQGGEIASSLASTIFSDDVYSKITSRTNRTFDEKTVLTDACSDANTTVYDYSRFDPSLSGMGTTLVGGIVHDGGTAALVNVGDSRAYRISPDGQEVVQITKDHSLVENLVSSGLLTKKQARIHPQKNVITRAIGAEERVEADFYEVKLNSGELLLLCSDGLTNYVTDPELGQAFARTGSAESCCYVLRELTYRRGAGDNLTMIAAVHDE